MFEVRHETVVAAGHQLQRASGDEERMHGHNWRVVAFVQSETLDERGMVVDFWDLGRILKRIVGPYDKADLNAIPPFDDIAPTAEGVALVVGQKLALALDDVRIRVDRVEVWENDTCGATYVLPKSPLPKR